MNYLTLNSTQARQAHSGERFTTWERMEPQPPSEFHYRRNENVAIWSNGGGLFSEKDWPENGRPLNSPYAPGDVVAVKEPWLGRPIWHEPDPTEREGCGLMQAYVVYAATPRRGLRVWPDQTPVTFLHESTPLTQDKWLMGPYLPADLLPDWAIRLHLRCLSIRAEQQGNEWGWAVEWEKATS